MNVIDNFLSPSDFDVLKNLIVCSSKFPWFYSKVLNPEYMVDGGKVDCEEVYNYQFSHMIYNNNLQQSEYYEIVYPFIDQLRIDSLVKCKINFNPRCEKIIEHGMHYDYPFKCLTAVYYFNTNNGYTKFETGEIVNSVENRIVVFDSKTLHTGSTCTDKQGRYVMNINFFAEEYKINL